MPNTTDGLRVAILSGSYDVDTIKRYLPSNYTAERVGTVIVVTGIDSAGWTLDDYVIPRLASGLYRAVEFKPEVAL